MTRTSITRRGFIASGANVVAGTLLYAGGPIAALAPSTSWALNLSTLDGHTGATLLQFTRHLYPHDTLEDAVYALVVKDLDGKAATDAATADALQSGVAELDAAAGSKWLELDPEQQLEIVAARETTPFFQTVRSTAVVALYNNELAFAHFGYEGPSFAKGGYIRRGFNDLDWLPAPPETASPAPA